MSQDLMNSCVVCLAGESVHKKLVKKPGVDKIRELLECCRERISLGEKDLQPVADRISYLDESQLENVRYHSECRKPLVNKDHLERARKRKREHSESFSPSSNFSGKGAGRPGKSPEGARPKRIQTVPKEIKCIFSPCSFCVPSDTQQLHRVLSDAMGQTLLDIKNKTKDDAIRICVSGLEQAGDAAAQEKYYHKKCVRYAQRTFTDNVSKDKMTRDICDELLLLSVKASLSDPGTVLNMNEINDEYVSILEEYHITEQYDFHHKRYLKDLIRENLPNVEFVKSVRKNESEKVILSGSVSQAVEFATTQNTSVDTLACLAYSLRKEILGKRDWKFNGDLSNFENPPMLQFFLNQLLFGPHVRTVTGSRDVEVEKTVDVACQFLVQNTRSDRQMKYKPKTDVGFRREGIETPLSIGLPISVHSRVRDKSLMTNLHTLYLGSDYRHILNIEKRIEHAVLQRMQDTGGYCLPDFVKKHVNVWFAIDNIDLLEDTPYGQNTFHGTLIVLNQREDKDAESINPPLVIPDKVPSEPLKVKVNYLEEPVKMLKPIHFEEYKFGQRDHLLLRYKHYTHTWALANHLANEKPELQGKCSSDLAGETSTLEESVPSDSLVQDKCRTEEQTMEIGLTPLASPPEVTVPQMDGRTEIAPILEVSSRPNKKGKLAKQNVMPTWAATKSLLLSRLKDVEVRQTNSEVIAPLFKTSPTEFATLYTVLNLTQNISATVVGPEKRTLITLDLDLYTRAIQIQESVGNRNWVLRAGVLHISFASLHALGKTIEGSGLDTCAIETGIYSSAALRGIYGGKAFKRGMEYHIINALAIMMMKYDAILSETQSESLHEQCVQLKEALHERDPAVADIFGDIETYYTAEIQGKEEIQEKGELAQFLDQYLEQVDSLLQLVSACRQGDWEGYLAALDNQVKYFFAHNLLNYARLMPLHIAQMNALEKEDPTTWEALTSGDFVVNKSDIPFTSLFTDQTLEQEIKKLKRHGGIVGLSQDEDALDRLLHTTPHLARIVNQFLLSFPQSSQDKTKLEEHYQLSGNISLRSSCNAVKLKNCVELHCKGNPYVNGTPLKSLVSSALIPEKAKQDIINYASIGQKQYQDFVEDRLLKTSQRSVWDKMTKLKLKTFSNWMAKTRVQVGDKVIKLREERQLLARFLIIQQSRPQLVPKLEATIGEYEMAVVPRSMFSVDGSLLLCPDKASLMQIIEQTAPEDSASEKQQPTNRVLIVDAMAVVQSMKKTPKMTKICHLKEAFVTRISRMSDNYDEVRVLFDRYVKDSLKAKTRAKRATSSVPCSYEVHDEMSISTIPLKDLLSSSETKSRLSELLAHALLGHFAGFCKQVVVAYSTVVDVNSPHTIRDEFRVHGHEEADTLIPLHVLDSLRDNTSREVCVRSPDTDVFILLMDLVSNGHLGMFAQLKFCTGSGSRYREIDVRLCVQGIGQHKAQGLIGLHNFTGADWGGKFVGISKKTWADAYLSLKDDDPIIDCFRKLGKGALSSTELVSGGLPPEVKPLETFVCKVYAPNGLTTLPALRWELFRSKNFEAEMLPPTRTTLMPHVVRTNFICMRDKSYISPNPRLPLLEKNGWMLHEGTIMPLKCLASPAPRAVLELVKCGCRTTCKGNCSCTINNLACTALCKCFTSGCSNFSDCSLTDNEIDDDDSEF